jgi:hypothetical protein
MVILFSFCTTHFSLIFTNVYEGLVSVMIKSREMFVRPTRCSQMRQNYSIGLENHILVGADMLVFISDCLGQMAMVR